MVTVTDDGGSSGRLREELQVLPPGDIRNCLVALAEVEPLMAELFQFRFPGEGQLAGHSFGNLFLAALTQVTGNFLHAIRISGKVLAVRGTILPSTLDAVRLGAELADGTRVLGESNITRQGVPIRRVFLEPGDARALPEVFEAIAHAHVVVLAPGSLYTSLIPNLLVGGVADALRAAAALKICVANLMTEPGETDRMSLGDHLDAVYAHGGRGRHRRHRGARAPVPAGRGGALRPGGREPRRDRSGACARARASGSPRRTWRARPSWRGTIPRSSAASSRGSSGTAAPPGGR